MKSELHAFAISLAPEGRERVRPEMQPDCSRWMEVQRVGSAAAGRWHGHHSGNLEPVRLVEEQAHGPLGHEREVARQQEPRARPALDRMPDASLRGDVLTFLARLDKNLSAEASRQRCGFFASCHDPPPAAPPGGANRARGVTPREFPTFPHPQREPETLPRGLERLDADDD